MQTTGSTTASPGWSRRTRIIVGVVVLVILVVWFSYLTVDYIWPGALEPPSEARRAEVIAMLTGQVRQELGTDLASVEARYGRDGLTPTYFVEYRLRGLPLVFDYSMQDRDLLYHGLGGWQVAGGSVGRRRFVALAHAFHDDFPAEGTMGYDLVQNPEDLPESLRPIAERPGPMVVAGTGEGETYRSLGVYSWNPQAKAWELVYRGAVPGYGN
jgi:hypothetical protein